jgi:hypothetical protein
MTNEQLAKRVIRQVRALTTKLKDLEADLRRLWVAFEKLPKGENILGCRTKAQFCEKRLRRSPAAVRYLLYGRTEEQKAVCQERMADERQRNNVALEQAQEILPPVGSADVPPPKKPAASVPIELGTDDAATVARGEAMHRMVAYLDRFEREEFETKLDDFIKDLRARCARTMGATA